METASGMVSIASPYSMQETLARLEAAIAGRGLQLFAHVDHGAGAAAAGLSMPPAHVLVFGQAKAGTPLMVARPLLALDLPLKVLIWQKSEGTVEVSFNSPDYLAERYALPAELTGPLRGVESLVKSALS